MIVSGFTQKIVKVENTLGCPLDHSHCITCVSRTCKVPANSITSCDVVDCSRGCHSRYHRCKENEHVLLCPEERVACINNEFGCPAIVSRRKLAEHLTVCPASIVHCRAEWNRMHIKPVRYGKNNGILMKRVYTDCGQLDTALAMRDHRALVDRLLSPQQMAVKSEGPVPNSPSQIPPLPSSSSEADVPADLPLRWDTTFQQLKKKAANSQPVAGLASASQCDPGQAESVGGEMVISAQRLTEEEKAGCCPDVEQDSEVLQDGQALGNVISLSLIVECFARGQPKASNMYTFPCGQDVRRDEFPHHFSAVHDRVHSDLNGWMEQRCPLAYLGCPFSFRRFSPNLPNMTLHHSWLLESFGVTAQSAQADFSHQTPHHLLPTFAETADCSDMSGECSGLNCVEHGYLECDPKSSPVPSQNCHNDLISFTKPSPSTCPPGSQTAEDFSTVPDIIAQEEGNTCQELNPTESQSKSSRGSADHPSSSVSGQLTQVNCHMGCAAKSHSDQDNIQNASSALPPTHHYKVVWELVRPSRRDKPQTKQKKTPEGAGLANGKQVIYTGLSANSCVRVNTTSTIATPISLSDSNREARPSPLQLNDLPSEIVCYITQFLDSFSLYNLSLVSHTMRDLCSTLLQDRGMVSTLWAKQQLDGVTKWRIVGKRWGFSTCFEPVESWRFTGHNPIPDHLLTCPYNQDRRRHTKAFSIIPQSETPLNIQIRDMLQGHLKQYRVFRGWVTRSSLDRELFIDTHPLDGHLAGLLVALGGTLPR